MWKSLPETIARAPLQGLQSSVMREIELISFTQEQFEAIVNVFPHSVLLRTSTELCNILSHFLMSTDLISI